MEMQDHPNGYYHDNMHQNVHDPDKTPEKQFVNGGQRYTPLSSARPVLVHEDDNGKIKNEHGTPDERRAMLPPVRVGKDWTDSPEDNEDMVTFPVFHSGDVEVLPAPKDAWNLVYIIMIIHGVGTLMPWNMFITANSYFTDYKLATNGTDGAEYRKNFISYLGITAQVPNVVLNAVNLFGQCGGRASSLRIVYSIVVMVVVFVITIVLAMVDSSEWPFIFFIVTMISVVILNMATGVYQNCVYGVAADLPMKYTNAVVLGSNISGTFTSVVNIISIASAPDPRTSAIYYFVAAVLVLLIAFDTYFVLPLLPFYKYFHQRGKIHHVTKEDRGPDDDLQHHAPPFWKIFKQIWVQCLSVWFVFFVTLALFPAIQVNVEMIDESFFIPEKYFTAITCFLFFNAFAMIGNLVTVWVQIPGPRFVWIPILIRGLIALPFFILCNYRPDVRSIPVLISNDYVYMVGGILMAFTSGYFSSLVMMYTPGLVDSEYAGTAGMMAAFFLVLGIFSGATFSLALSEFVESVGTWF